MSDKKIIAPLRQLTDLEYMCITGLAQLKDIKGEVSKLEDTKEVRLSLAINKLEHRVSLALGEKFGLNPSEIIKSNFDLTIKSGHFVELINKDEKVDNTSGE
jgi:hypothetical protein